MTLFTNFILTTPQFPVGTAVGLYPASDEVRARLGEVPQGSALQTQTVGLGGSLTFLNLNYNTNYFAYAVVDGKNTWLWFRTQVQPPTLTEVISTTLGGNPYKDLKADFGAKGDGVTVDTVAIQTALDYMIANGGTLWVPAGTYIHGPLTFNNSQSHGVSIMGAGGDGSYTSVFKYTAVSGTVPGLKIYSSSSWSMSGLHFQYQPGFAGKLVDVNGKGAGGSGADCQQWSIEHCYFDYSNSPFSGSCTALLSVDNSVIANVSDCRFIGAVAGIKLGETQYVNVFEAERNMFARMTLAGIVVQSPDGEMITIRGNTFEAKAKILGLTGNALYKPLIEGNWFGDAVQDIIWIDGLVCQSSARMGTIRDNEFGPNCGFVSAVTPNIKLGDPNGSNQVGAWLIEGNDSIAGTGLSCYATNPSSGSITFNVISNTFAGALWNATDVPNPITAFSGYMALGNGGDTDYIAFLPPPSLVVSAGFAVNVGTKALIAKGQLLEMQRGSTSVNVVKNDFSAAQYQFPINGWFEVYSSNVADTGLTGITASAGVTLTRAVGTAAAIKPGGTVRFRQTALNVWHVTGDLVQTTTAFNLHAGTATHDLPSGATLVQTEQALRGLIADLQAKGHIS